MSKTNQVILSLGIISIATCAQLDTSYLPPRREGNSFGRGQRFPGVLGGNTGFSGGASRFSGNTGTFSGGLGHYQSLSSSGGNFGSGAGSITGSGHRFSEGGSASFSNQPQISIVRFANENTGDGSYRYEYETSNGISAQEQGVPGGTGAVLAQGSFLFRAPDGGQYSITYTADENGFHPQGAHLPTPPPIPEAILRSIEFNKAEEARGDYRDDGGEDGQYRLQTRYQASPGQFKLQTQYQAPQGVNFYPLNFGSNFRSQQSSSGGYTY